MPRRMSTAKRAKTVGSILTGFNAVVLFAWPKSWTAWPTMPVYGYMQPLPFVKSRGAPVCWELRLHHCGSLG